MKKVVTKLGDLAAILPTQVLTEPEGIAARLLTPTEMNHVAGGTHQQRGGHYDQRVRDNTSYVQTGGNYIQRAGAYIQQTGTYSQSPLAEQSEYVAQNP